MDEQSRQVPLGRVPKITNAQPPIPPEAYVRRLAALCSVLTCLVAVAAAGPATAGSAGTFSSAASPRTGIGHVWVVVLENEGIDKTFLHNANPYLGKTLQKQGTLLTNYYATAHLSNPNYIAMMSGQAPNPLMQSDCQDYVDFQPSPAVFDPRGNGQAVGTGCVLPRNVLSLPDQLQARGITWHGYMEDMGKTLSREPDRCGQPASSAGTGMQDGTQSATATDQYAARHNPFVYFHSLIDSGSCERNVVPLTHLAPDLGSLSTTPQFNFVVPNLCDDGHDAPCTGKDVSGSQAGGLASADHFLQMYVPKIMASPAFKKDGLLLVVADETDGQDAASCCGETPGPNSPAPGIYVQSNNGQGGGLIGALAVGRCVRAGATSAQPYNHYSLLRSLEDLYGVTTGGADGHGHLGFAGAADVKSFGTDLFAACPSATRTAAHSASSSGGSSRRSASAGASPLPATGMSAALPLFALVLLTLAAAFGRLHRLRRP